MRRMKLVKTEVQIINIPWVEKYRPKTINEMIGFEKIAQQLKEFIEKFFTLQNKIFLYC